jgi:transcriptional regulator with XRE-family HTH domain
VTKSTFGDELRRLRRAAKLTLADLAEAIDVSIVYVSQIERGDRSPPKVEDIRKLAKRLGVPAEADRLVALADRSRPSVQIPLKGKSERETDVLLALARESEQGGLPEEAVQELFDILQKYKRGDK